MNDQSQLAEMIRGMKVLQAGIGQKIRSGNLVFFIWPMQNPCARPKSKVYAAKTLACVTCLIKMKLASSPDLRQKRKTSRDKIMRILQRWRRKLPYSLKI